MRRSLALVFTLLKREPLLLVRFAGASLGRGALQAAAIVLLREFLGGALGTPTGVAAWFVQRFGQSTTLWVVGGLLAAVQGAAIVLAYDAQVSQQRIVKSTELHAMERVIRHLLSLSAGFFDRRTRGDLIQSVRQDVSQLRGAALAAGVAVLDATQGLALIVAAAWLSPTLALWAFVLLPSGLGPLFLLARRTLSRAHRVRRRSVVLFDALLQLLGGIRVIKVYGGEEAEATRTIDRARRFFDELIALERTRALAAVVLDAVASVGLFAVVIVGGLQVMRGTLDWPSLLAFLMAVRAAQTPINSAVGAYADIQRHAAGVEAFESLLAERSEVRDAPDAQRLEAAPQRIVLHDVSYGVDGHDILRGISATVSRGETLGIVGPSGAGKSTLLGLLARFHDPTAGYITLDDVDLRALQLTSVHAAMAIVTQDPFLFQTSIRENIRCVRPDATDAEVEAAAAAADIHEDVLRMPDGYDTVVGHGGRPLSRGEAQRVNIARAVLKNAPILLLDEASSSLDSVAEARVQAAIDRLMVGRLTISVAHRLSTLRNATRILVLEEGRVAGLGTHAELLAECATYQALWRTQTAP